MRKEHTRLQAEQAASLAAAEKKAAASAKEEAAPGIPLGFNPIRSACQTQIVLMHFKVTSDMFCELAECCAAFRVRVFDETDPQSTCGLQSCLSGKCRAVKGKDGEAVHETELHSELQRLKAQMKAIDASIAAARSQLENLKKEDERTVWETNIVILKASQPHSVLQLTFVTPAHLCPCVPQP